MAKEKRRSNWRPVWLLVIASLLVLGLMIWNVIIVQNRILQGVRNDYIQDQTENISSTFVRAGQENEKLALKIAADEKIMAACQAEDDARLDKMLQPLFRQWKQIGGVAELSLISAEGKALWSSRAGVSSGDDLSYQRITGKSLQQRKSLSAVEAGEKETMLITTWPLFDENEYWGLCRIGLSLPYLGSQLQKQQTGRLALFHLNGIDNELLWQNQKTPSGLNTNDIKKLHDGEIISRPLGYSARLLMVPLQDIDGITVAYIQNHLPLQQYVWAEALNYLMLLLALGFMVLANYALGKNRFDDEDDRTHLAGMSKINSVAFKVGADRTSKHAQEE